MAYITKPLFLSIFLFFSIVSFAQEGTGSTDQIRQDSVAEARKKDYEERLRNMKEMERRMRRDYKGFRDSIAMVRKAEKQKSALERMEDYRSDPKISELKEIDLSGAQLKKIPPFVFKATNLEILVLDGNQISTLPEELNKLDKLKRIYWRENDLGGRKVRIPRLTGIEKLDLSGNGLTRLPKVQKIKGIEELVLESNQFEKIPLWRVRKLKSLKELDISQNPVQLDRRWYWLVKDLKILKINKSEIASIHPSLYKIEGLEELQLQVNNLRSIPEGISQLGNLRKLSLYKNQLDDLPEDFYDLAGLTVVDLYYNKLRKIPSGISKLRNLKILYLSFNEIYDLSPEIGELSKLQELYIHHNKISEVPYSVSNLDSLRVFHLQHNYIPQFPAQILSMHSLRDVDISYTDITSIPVEVENLPLKNFYWKDLKIDPDRPQNAEFREMILRMMDNGTNVSPRIETD